MDNKNGYFKLEIKEDGTYIKLIPPVGTGKAVDYNDVNNYLADRKIYDYDVNALGRALLVSKEKAVEVKLTSAKLATENETVNITITPDKMVAYGRFFPPSGEGKELTMSDIVSSLAVAGVRYGVIQENIESFIKSRIYNEDIILSKGVKPLEGKEAVIVYNFNTDNTLKPKQNEDGTVDFHKLDMISSISKGDVLATLSPAIPGKPGMDVCGAVLTPKKVIQRILKHGKDIHLSEDGLTMFADVSGHATLTDGKVFVSNTYDVLADVDSSTGDIEYEGNVSVKGNVLTGYSIRAKGDIIINGVVEGASLIAGGQIILKRGMQGMSKGTMEAGGNIITKFIENAVVKAGGYITTEAILHCKVMAKGDITVGGKKGLITGGTIQSGTMITAKTAGSMMGTQTILEVGIDPGIVDAYRGLEKKIASLESDLDKLLPIMDTYKKKISSGEVLSQEKLDYIRMATKNCITLRAEIKELTKQYEQLRAEIGSSDSGSIRIENVAYSGVKVVISNVNYFVKTEIHYTRFIRDKADIKLVPL
jgi:uncharacterized protein (DUF342 family)